jgi:hypothetical protein
MLPAAGGMQNARLQSVCIPVPTARLQSGLSVRLQRCFQTPEVLRVRSRPWMIEQSFVSVRHL